MSIKELKMNDCWITYAMNIHTEILMSGYVRVDHTWGCKNGCAPFSRLYYIEKGEGQIYIDGEYIPLFPGNLYLIPAGLVYDYACDTYMKKLYFHVNITLSDGFDIFQGCKECYVHPCGSEEIEQIIALYRNEKIESIIALKGRIMSDMANLVELAKIGDGRIRSYSKLLQTLFSIVLSPVSAKYTVRLLAQRLHVSESTLSKKFKQEIGMTLGCYLDQIVWKHACQMLLSTNLPVGAIAEELGFSDQFYFSKSFKKISEETPSSYRKRFRGGNLYSLEK